MDYNQYCRKTNVAMNNNAESDFETDLLLIACVESFLCLYEKKLI